MEVKWGSAPACPSSRDIDSGSVEVLCSRLDIFCFKFCLISKMLNRFLFNFATNFIYLRVMRLSLVGDYSSEFYFVLKRQGSAVSIMTRLLAGMSKSSKPCGG